MDDFLISEENMEVFEKIKALKKDKYTMKDVDALCELLGLELFWYQKVFVLFNLNEKIFQKEILKST